MTEGCDLVIQAPVLPADAVAALAQRCNAAAVIPAGAGTPSAYRFPDIARDAALQDAAAHSGCDAAFVRRAHRLDRVCLVAMDMDSTLITIECIDEIADMMGIKPDVAAITVQCDARGDRFRGKPDAAARPCWRDSRWPHWRASTRSACACRLGRSACWQGFKAAGAKTALLSGGFTFFTERLKARLRSRLRDVEHPGDRGRQADRAHRRGHRRRERQGRDAASPRSANPAARMASSVAIGDGANDLPMFAEADVSVAYRAKPVVRAAATHAIDHCGLDGVLNLFL